MPSRHLTLLLALLLSASVARAEPPVDTAEPPGREAGAAEDVRAEDPMVCRRVTPTGSRLARKVCRPQSEWVARSKGGGVKTLRQSDCGAGNCDITPLPRGGS